MSRSSDRNIEYMRLMWGTEELITDYNNSLDKKVLREINHDNEKCNHNCNCNCDSSSILSE